MFFACCAPHKLFQVQDFTKPQHLAKILKIFRLREEFVTEAKERISKVIRESGGYDDNVTLVCGHVRLGDYGRHISIKGGSGSGFANATYFRRAMDHFVFNLKVRHFTRFSLCISHTIFILQVTNPVFVFLSNDPQTAREYVLGDNRTSSHCSRRPRPCSFFGPEEAESAELQGYFPKYQLNKETGVDLVRIDKKFSY